MQTRWRRAERAIVISSRFLTAAAVVGALCGAVLMFLLGLYEIYRAFEHVVMGPGEAVDGVAVGAAAVISVIEALDRFLIAIVLLYFAYGVYSLFIHPEQAPEEAQEELALPQWLRVKQIGQLKQVVAEVIVVILFVLFLRVALQVFQGPGVSLTWTQIGTLLLLPVAAALLALALRLVALHPKPRSDRLWRDGEGSRADASKRRLGA